MTPKDAMRAAVEALSLMYANSHGTTDDEISARLRARSALSLLRSALDEGGEPNLTDEQAEALIENSGGHWKEDVFCIGGPELMALLRAAASPIAADTQGDATQQKGGA